MDLNRISNLIIALKNSIFGFFSFFYKNIKKDHLHFPIHKRYTR